ncbi:hypothetical protein PILCRDRAFT_14218 [Piloderma croceum F 1598]|uniref:Uncharacterized protein n=1 Tax=Piloderma croceum (strain F 1598) TaxID=765440 RepID=A0A0C3ALA3_PILCF|nr:hypothetical protein PILCRDRAFT_14218 [Piloderma croceum F 1598]
MQASRGVQSTSRSRKSRSPSKWGSTPTRKVNCTGVEDGNYLEVVESGSSDSDDKRHSKSNRLCIFFEAVQATPLAEPKIKLPFSFHLGHWFVSVQQGYPPSSDTKQWVLRVLPVRGRFAKI